jgi:hypothetical protein
MQRHQKQMTIDQAASAAINPGSYRDLVPHVRKAR